MLNGLGKWLRIAGYDTKIITQPMRDEKIVECAIAEERLLLTRDKKIKPNANILFLNGNTLEECVRELNQHLQINWLYRPFSRCPVCNTAFTESADADLQDVPEDVRAHATPLWYCSTCNKVYWEGSHTARMRKQLEAWQSS